MDCDDAFDEWYKFQRHQLNNEELCRLIWTRGWQAAEKEWREPLTKNEVKMLATYMPEGVHDDDIEDLVRRVEQMHAVRPNAKLTCNAKHCQVERLVKWSFVIHSTTLFS